MTDERRWRVRLVRSGEARVVDTAGLVTLLSEPSSVVFDVTLVEPGDAG